MATEVKIELVACYYWERCMHKKTSKCAKCKNNHNRNKERSFFIEANDNPIPDECPHLTYSGSAEQTAGYKCPVCGEFTNPYHLDKDNRCSGCGYKLNVG